MPQPVIKIPGIYKVELTEKLFEEAMEMKYEGIQLSDSQRKAAEKDVREELSSVVLVDALINNPDERFDVGDFQQPGSDQAAYNEAFLSLDGASILSRYKQPEGDAIRVAFFLHFFDPANPLATSYGEVSLPAVQPMPENFKKLVPYEPVG